MYLFGKDIAYTLHAFDDGLSIGLIPAQTYNAFIYDKQPSRTEALTGAGSLSTIVVTHALSNTLIISIPAIDDPDPESFNSTKMYYVAVVFKLATAEQDQLIIRALPLERVQAKDKTIGVTTAKIKEVFPTINKFLGDSEIQAMIYLAQNEILNDLKSKGFKWSEIHRPDQLFSALLFKSLQYINTSQIQRQGDRFSVSAELNSKSYSSQISFLKILIEDESGNAKKEEKGGGVLWALR